MKPDGVPGRFAGIQISDTLVDTGYDEVRSRPEFDGHLGTAAFLALAASPSRVVVIDHHPQRREWKAGVLLALAVSLARRWRSRLPEPRVGVALPPGIGAFAANLGLMLAGRIPVNLNFTLGRSAAEACLARAGIRTVISAPALREKAPAFAWPEETLDIRQEIAACGRWRVIGWLAAIRLLSATWLARRLGLPARGGNAEATLLFTSGSAGEPKAVVLSHRNLIANCWQTRETGLLRPGETILGCLPVFHSFGFTVTLWYPVLHDMRVATFPSPLETRRLAGIIEAERLQVLVGAATFLRPYLKRAEPEQLRSLRLVVAGAEKLPGDLAEAFLQRFGVPIREGYGLTETSPVLAVNRPDPVALAGGGARDGHRPGSVGLLVRGMQARILDPDTNQPGPPGRTGVLAVRGPNVFGGYLGDPVATEAVLRDGWFRTGDLARFDEEGFLFIEGRLSRFSKIGGEMVPHVTIEQRLIELFGWEGAETQPVVVLGVADETKGEALVVLTSEDLTSEAMLARFSAAGLPNLWIPKRVLRVAQIPTLSSGKLDLQSCRRLAEAALGDEIASRNEPAN